MKKAVLVGLFLLFFAITAQANTCLSGSFYDPEAPGSGINVEVLEDQTVVYFYREDNDWFIMQDNTVYQNWAGDVTEVGVGDLVWVDDDNVVFSYNLLLDVHMISFERPIPWCLRSDCKAEFEYVRLTQPNPCD